MKPTITILIFAASLLISSCAEKKPETIVKKDSSQTMTVKKDTSLVVKKEMKTNTGKVFTIYETKPSYSVSNFFVSGQGFENYSDTIKFQNENPMVNALVTDLDKDGFDELYILTKATGSGSFMDIIGIASNKDKSYGEINVQEITAENIERDQMFAGYQGHDSVYIAGNVLVREFPVYRAGDDNANPTGGRRKIVYALKPGEAAYQLVITGEEKLK